jgi:VWFA-related protein
VIQRTLKSVPRASALLILSFCAGLAQETPSSPPTAAVPGSAPPVATQSPAKPQAEVTQKDEPALFRARVNLVPVPVVVRDGKGKAIGTLKQDDFQLFDRGKQQYIARFSVEKAAGRQVKNSTPAAPPNPASPLEDKPAVEAPERFIAYLFDDIHTKFGDLAKTRDAARHHIDNKLRTTDRAAVFTTSGRNMQDFTDDRALLHQALDKLRVNPVTGQGSRNCPHMNYYIADRMINRNDSIVQEAVINDVMVCMNYTSQMREQAKQVAETAARNELPLGEQETRLAMNALRELVRRMGAMPGQRNIVLVSSGFLTMAEHATDKTDIMERAIHSNVIVNALDARGLYVNMPDIARRTATFESERVYQQMEHEAMMAQANVMAEVSSGTGGTFFQNSNDIEGGFERLSAAPEYYYLLAFSPQNLKMDGAFHSLKVSLKGLKDVHLSARTGYYAPRKLENAIETAKREIEEALFSREEMADIPLDVHTQFFKPTEDTAKVTVLAHLDVKSLRFRHEADRNHDDLTVVVSLFDRNGVYVTGVQKKIEMKLKDETLEKRLEGGLTVRSALDAKPGVYSVRVIVRDTEGQLMSARNTPLDIPY